MECTATLSAVCREGGEIAWSARRPCPAVCREGGEIAVECTATLSAVCREAR